MKVRYILAGILALLLINNIYAQPIVKSINNLTQEEFQQMLQYDPELQGWRFLPYAEPNRLERYVEPPKVQEVILTPLRVEGGPQFVRPQELFALKVVLRNKDNIAYQMAIIRKPEPGLLQKVIGFIPWLIEQGANFLKNVFGWLFGGQQQSQPQVQNETWEIVPIYYLIAALDPEVYYPYYPGGVITTEMKIYPGGLVETKPGYGCYDIVLGNEYQMAQVIPKLERGEISFDQLMCGQIAEWGVGPFKIRVADSLFGPITIALPVQLYKEGGQVGKAIVAVKNGEVAGVITGCTDKGDGEPYTMSVVIGGRNYTVVVPSQPGDCILTPGETMEFYVYGIVNPIPSAMLSPQAVGEVLTTLYTGTPEQRANIMAKYPGAIHEVLLVLGRINSKEIPITGDDIKQTIGSFVTPAIGAGVGFYFGGPIGAAIGAGVGLLVNYLATGSPFKLPAIQKAMDAIFLGKYAYTASSVLTAKTYLVIVAPQFEVSVYLIHYGLIVLAIVLGGYLGMRAAGGGA